MNHFTSPNWFAKKSGWLVPDAPERFARYCGIVTDRFGDRISHAVTLNEPNLPRLLSWLHLPAVVHHLERAGLETAGTAAGVERYRASNVVLPEEFDAIGDGLEAGHRAARAAIKERHPVLPVGFIGVQNYEQMTYDGNGDVPPAAPVECNQMGSAIVPAPLGGAVRYAYGQTGVPILVTEHGLATADDTQRVAFLSPSLDGLFAAMSDGIPVRGYLHWTLLDNFEWVFGYESQLGLHHVDRQTYARTPKPSASTYAALVESHSPSP